MCTVCRILQHPANRILLLSQHVSDTTMPIIRSSRVLYSSCCLLYLVLWFSSRRSGVELRVMCTVCRILQHPANKILVLAQHVSGTTMPIIRSSRVLYSSCCLWYLVMWFSSFRSGVELRVMCPVWKMLLCTKYHRQQPLCNKLELLMMGIVVPETC